MANFKLAPHPTIPQAEGPVLVCILDGWGVNVEDQYNAIFAADTPCTDALKAVPKRYRSVKAHGTAVGLPSDADMGNSEVGHNALGSGQVIDQGARLVDIALETGKMFEDAGWKYISPAFANNTVHLIGLLSDGGVHSRYNQLIGTIEGLVKSGAKRIRVHILTDGRDVPDGSSVQFTGDLVKFLKGLEGQGVDAKVASGGGRMGVTMDRYEVRLSMLSTRQLLILSHPTSRDRWMTSPGFSLGCLPWTPCCLKASVIIMMFYLLRRCLRQADWNIVKKGWDAHVLGKAPNKFTDAVTAVKTLRVSVS